MALTSRNADYRDQHPDTKLKATGNMGYVGLGTDRPLIEAINAAVSDLVAKGELAAMAMRRHDLRATDRTGRPRGDFDRRFFQGLGAAASFQIQFSPQQGLWIRACACGESGIGEQKLQQLLVELRRFLQHCKVADVRQDKELGTWNLP